MSMNKVHISQSHNIFYGFILQNGFLFGETKDDYFVSNGHLKRKDGAEFFSVYFLRKEEAKYAFSFEDQKNLKNLWHQKSVFKGDPCFNVLCKGLRAKERKFFKEGYYSDNELEAFRWENDPGKHHFQKSVPFSSKCRIPDKNANNTARFKSIRESKQMTQRVNTCMYNSSNGKTTII